MSAVKSLDEQGRQAEAAVCYTRLLPAARSYGPPDRLVATGV